MKYCASHTGHTLPNLQVFPIAKTCHVHCNNTFCRSLYLSSLSSHRIFFLSRLFDGSRHVLHIVFCHKVFQDLCAPPQSWIFRESSLFCCSSYNLLLYHDPFYLKVCECQVKVSLIRMLQSYLNIYSYIPAHGLYFYSLNSDIYL